MPKISLNGISDFYSKDCYLPSEQLKYRLSTEERMVHENVVLDKKISDSKLDNIGRNYLEFISEVPNKFPLLILNKTNNFCKFKAEKDLKKNYKESVVRNINNNISKKKLLKRKENKKYDKPYLIKSQKRNMKDKENKTKVNSKLEEYVFPANIQTTKYKIKKSTSNFFFKKKPKKINFEKSDDSHKNLLKAISVQNLKL